MEALYKQEKISRTEVMEKIPELVEGVNIITDGGGKPVLQSILADELSKTGKKAVWIDVGNESSTYALASSDKALMEKVRVGRAFTAFQHLRMFEKIEEYIDEETEVVVAPNFTSIYLGSSIGRWEARELFEHAWEKLIDLVESYELKLLVSLEEKSSEMSHVVINDAKRSVEVEKTSEGLSYSSEDFRTEFYSGKTFFQTTMAYWEKVVG